MSVGSEAASGNQRRLMRIDTRGAIVDARLRGVKEEVERWRKNCSRDEKLSLLLVSKELYQFLPNLPAISDIGLRYGLVIGSFVCQALVKCV